MEAWIGRGIAGPAISILPVVSFGIRFLTVELLVRGMARHEPLINLANGHRAPMS